MHLGVALNRLKVVKSWGILIADEGVQANSDDVVGQSWAQQEHDGFCVELEVSEIQRTMVFIESQAASLEVFLVEHDESYVTEDEDRWNDQKNGIGNIAEERSTIREIIIIVCNEEIDGGEAKDEDDVVDLDEDFKDVAEVAFDWLYLEVLGLFFVEQIAFD